MTDERQNLDSEPSTTATEPGEQANAEPGEAEQNDAQTAPPEQSAGAAEPPPGDADREAERGAAGEQATTEAAAAEPAPAGDDEGEAQPAGEQPEPTAAAEGAQAAAGGEEAASAAVEPAGGEEGGAPAAVGEVAASEEVEAAGEAAADRAGESPEGQAPEAVQAAETAAPVKATGEAVTTAAPTEPQTAEPEGREAGAAEAAAPEEPQGAPAAEGAGGAGAPEQAAAPRQEAAATPTAEAAATSERAETSTPQPEAGAAPTTGGETAAEQAEATTPPAEAEAAPAEAEEPEDPALAELREAREKGTTVEGRVIGWNRGGFHVVVGPVTAFCPSSEMEVGRPKGPQSYVEKTFPFKVIKYQKKGRRVVLSRAAVLAGQREEVLAGLKPGATVKGRVTSLPDFGAFVDLGGVEGLVHVSEISRSRVQHPKDALQPGQEVEVKVLKIEQGGERISLSMKDLEPDPWQGAGQRFSRGDRFTGKALRKTEFGLFVELEPEVEGLLHVSQLPPGKTLDDPAYQPGQPIEGWVREVEPKRQRISLSLREVPTDDPWKEIAKRFPEGEMVEGTVESVAPFGVFVSLAPGVTGLLPNSQTGLPRGTNAARAFSPGQTTRVQVISVDARRKRISLGREGTHVEASRNDLQDFKRQEREREKEQPTAMAAAFARLREGRDEASREEQ